MEETPIIKGFVLPEGVKAADMVRLWDNNKVIGETPTTDRTKIVVAASIRDGYRYVNLREFYRTADGEWKPGTAGLCIPLHVISIKDNMLVRDVVDKVRDLMDIATEEVKDLPLYDADNVVYRARRRKKE